MKRSVIALLCIFFLYGCEEVVFVDLQEAEKRIVIDASIKCIKGTDGSDQKIRVSKTRGFYEEEPVPVTDASVTITMPNDQLITFTNDEDQPGTYTTNEFLPELNETYELNVQAEGQQFQATETLKPVVPIDSITQRNDSGFSGEEIEIKTHYTDPGGVENYYLFAYRVPFIQIPTLEIFDDEFNDGNPIFSTYQEEDLESGNVVNIQMQGISRQYYDYLFLLLSQVGDSGGPFQTRPATVRGNIINTDNEDNYPFGYFSLSEVDTLNYLVQ
jgi:hypothetical protein